MKYYVIRVKKEVEFWDKIRVLGEIRVGIWDSF